MIRISSRTRRLAGVGALVAGAFATAALGSGAGVASAGATAGTPLPAVLACAGTGRPRTSAARVAKGATAQEPKLYPDNQAKAYGVIKDAPRMPNGSVHIRTVFHVVSDHTLTPPRAPGCRR